MGGSAFKVSGAYGEPIALSGVLDQHADLSFFERLRGPTVINLRGVERIDSVGVRGWIESLRNVPAEVPLRFIECPAPLIEHINMIEGFLCGRPLSSFYAPMACAACGDAADVLFEVDACKRLGGKLPPSNCARCGKPLELDEIEDRYLTFLRDP
jgi:hypothetical protein